MHAAQTHALVWQPGCEEPAEVKAQREQRELANTRLELQYQRAAKVARLVMAHPDLFDSDLVLLSHLYLTVIEK
jgi:hypothetical protein